MSNNDYSFMKSGFNVDSAKEQIEKEMENIAVLFTIFAEESMRLAVVYSKHCNRTVTATEDFSRAFKVRAFHGTEFWSMPHVQQKIEEVQKMIREEESNDVTNSDDNDEEMEEDKKEPENEYMGFDVVSDEDMEPYNESSCPCIVCRYMNTINKKWPDWKPDGHQDIILKSAIDQKF